MTNPNDLAFPLSGMDSEETNGLTKREYFAAMAMQGLLAGSEGKVNWTEKQFAIGAINLADALIAGAPEMRTTGFTLGQTKKHCKCGHSKRDHEKQKGRLVCTVPDCLCGEYTRAK